MHLLIKSTTKLLPTSMIPKLKQRNVQSRINVELYLRFGRHSTENLTNLFHLLCSTGLHALGFGVLHGPTVA